MTIDTGHPSPEPHEKPATNGANQSSILPLFYRQPVALSATFHSELSLAATENYSFACDANALPLTLNEFEFACRHYPIVFSASNPPTPLAVTGIAKDRNLFVDGRGFWQEGAYIPAYVRRYPFILLEDTKTKNFSLGVDLAASCIKETPNRENKLFSRDKPTEITQRALQVCMEYQANIKATRAFCDELEKERLFVEQEAGFDLNSGRKFRLTGFRVVDETRFNRTPGRAFLRLHRRLWLRPIYLHLLSAANWSNLLDMAAKVSG